MIARGTAMFADRTDAGRRLGAALSGRRGGSVLVLALPRGGVPVGLEVARALDAPLDVLLVRKITAPAHPELAIGAVVDGSTPQLLLDDQLVAATGATAEHIAAEKARQLREIERRRQAYRGTRPAPEIRGRTVIVVDDGIATGATMRIALRALARSGAARVIVAVPVAPPDVLELIRAEADEVVCLRTPEPFHAVGFHYDDFDQTSDEEVVRALAEAGRGRD
ncbi:phosphoribosyltransferase (plasmid) [Paracoccus denitrificans]|uniref:Phosphoribosyltransferase n=2 Tax=Paracoccaceae TaxID=31989 RepID=A1BB81_PARDP|nr:phosphoribosyltransferase [Paracoccus denitrificans PD1222]QAR29736.1 phosphoribosyltransferase [Paracoccus denitrificans]